MAVIHYSFAVCIFYYFVFILPQPGDSKMTFAFFELTGRGSLVSALPKDTTSELAGLSPHFPF